MARNKNAARPLGRMVDYDVRRGVNRTRRALDFLAPELSTTEQFWSIHAHDFVWADDGAPEWV